MPSVEQKNNSKVVKLFNPATVTADQASITAVDTKGYESVLFIAHIGASGDTLSGSVLIDVELEESDNNTDFTDCANAALVDSVTGTNTGTFARIDAPGEASSIYNAAYIGSKRYVRPVINVTGTHTNGTVISICAVLQKPKYAPAV